MKENMFLRRKLCKKIASLSSIVMIFYGVCLLYGDWRTPKVMSLTDLSRCPACYGISVCPELYSGQITLDRSYAWNLFNEKNIFYGITKLNRRIVLKKLAHNWELKEFDSKICEILKLEENCKPKQLLNVSNLDKELIKVVQYNFTQPETTPRKGLIMCPYAFSVFDLVSPILGKEKHKVEMLYIWTMLNVNPEPIILQTLKRSAGWPVSTYGGVCGRLEIVAHEGEPLATLTHVPWLKKLKYALKILEAAMDFTYKHDRFRFYLMDWSLDNIVANGQDDITFVDLEDVIVLDKHISPGSDLPDWYKRYKREPMGSGFSFSIENMCKHHLSDHNLWAACYLLAGEEEPFLYPIPYEISNRRPALPKLLTECLNGDDKFQTVTNLHHVIKDMLADEKLAALCSS